METILLETIINAPIRQCFDTARSIDMHLDSMKHTGERAIAGKTSGYINEGETVTWKARHFGILFRMQVRITACQPYFLFTDEMERGPFRKMKHQHFFEETLAGVRMRDIFFFESPGGFIGKLVDRYILAPYLLKLLLRRNHVLKATAERSVVSTAAFAS
ncbi:MAG: SRPBCC family protein [Chitinophagaceae bacterium]